MTTTGKTSQPDDPRHCDGAFLVRLSPKLAGEPTTCDQDAVYGVYLSCESNAVWSAALCAHHTAQARHIAPYECALCHTPCRIDRIIQLTKETV